MKKEQSSRKKTDQNFWATEKILVVRHETKVLNQNQEYYYIKVLMNKKCTQKNENSN